MHAILVHGYKGFPENCWFPWLRRELEARGWTTEAPQLPHPVLPTRKAWVNVLLPLLQAADPSQTVLIGHSLGCVTLMYALEKLRPQTPFAQAVLCAGFARDFHGTDRLVHWFSPVPDIPTIRGYVKRWTCVHSTDDYLVPYAEGEWMAAQIGADLVTLHALGHLMKSDGASMLPSALEAIVGA